MDNYVLRLLPEAVKHYLEIIRGSFSSLVPYRGKNYHRDTIIQLKAQELARFIICKTEQINFDEPAPNLAKEDTGALEENNGIINFQSQRARYRKDNSLVSKETGRREEIFQNLFCCI